MSDEVTVRQRIEAARSRNPNCIPPCDHDENCTACDIELELAAAITALDDSDLRFTPWMDEPEAFGWRTVLDVVNVEEES